MLRHYHTGFHYCSVWAGHMNIMARKCAPPGGLQKKKRRTSRVADEVKEIQKSVKLILPKSSFRRLIREVCQGQMTTDLRVTEGAYDALQEAAEAHVIKLFKDAQKIATKEKRTTLKVEDMQIVQELRGERKEKKE